MINICQPLMISRKHAYVLLSVMLILIIVNHLCILDSFRAEMRKLSNKFTISSVLTEGDPVTAAQGGVNVVTNLFNGNFTVCIEGGYCIKTKDFPTSLVLAFKLIFILNVGYKGPSKCVYGAIEALSGIKMRQKVHLGTNSKDLVQRLQRPK